MEFKVDKVKVYGVPETLIASGYPKSIDIKCDDNEANINALSRAYKLGKAPVGSGHDCFLKGIIFQADVTASHAFWIQYLRYHFCDIISSQSKMHKITEMDLRLQCNKYVEEDIFTLCETLLCDYKVNKTKENFHKLIYNLPLGLMLTARVTDNYLSLKTQYYQRKTDKLEEWDEYLKVIFSLPYFKDLCIKEFTNV